MDYIAGLSEKFPAMPSLWINSRTYLQFLVNLFTVIVILLCVNHLAESRPICSYLEVRTCNENYEQCHCIPCKSCPPGQGLDPECGSQVVLQVPFCVGCQKGLTYSSEDSVGSCQPCPLCHGKTVLQPCNTTHPTICNEDCAEGFKLDDVSGDCQPIHQPTPSMRSSKAPVVITPPKEVKSSATSNESLSIHVDKRSPSDDDRKSKQYPINPESSKHSENHVTQYIFGAVGIAIAYAIAYMVYKNWGTLKPKLRRALKHRWCSKSTINDDEIPLQGIIPDSVLLNTISPDLQRKIVTLINKESRGIKNWRDIGHTYSFTRLELDEIAESYRSDTTSPGDDVIEKIISKKPEETLNAFIAVLRGLKRQDVIKVIKDEYTTSESSPNQQ